MCYGFVTLKKNMLFTTQPNLPDKKKNCQVYNIRFNNPEKVSSIFSSKTLGACPLRGHGLLVGAKNVAQYQTGPPSWRTANSAAQNTHTPKLACSHAEVVKYSCYIM